MLLNYGEYFSLIDNIKQQIRKAQYRASLSVNREQILLYWDIGNVC